MDENISLIKESIKELIEIDRKLDKEDPDDLLFNAQKFDRLLDKRDYWNTELEKSINELIDARIRRMMKDVYGITEK